METIKGKLWKPVHTSYHLVNPSLLFCTCKPADYVSNLPWTSHSLPAASHTTWLEWITNQPATTFTKLTGTKTLNTTLRGQQSVFLTKHIFNGDLHPSLGEQYGYHGVIPGQTKLICACKCLLQPPCYIIPNDL